MEAFLVKLGPIRIRIPFSQVYVHPQEEEGTRASVPKVPDDNFLF